MTPVQIAYRAWADKAPFRMIMAKQAITYRDKHAQQKTFTEPCRFDGHCCDSENGHAADCEREKLWQKYVDLRGHVVIKKITTSRKLEAVSV